MCEMVQGETTVEAAGNTLTARSDRDGWTLTKTLTSTETA